MSLLRESTTHLREGRHRLPTPDRVAIMDLSSSFEKRRLGKQQQILSEITQRCREQEVTDLCSKITAKVDLKKTQDSDDIQSMYAAASRMPPMRPRPLVPHDSLSSEDIRDVEAIEKRVKSEKGYKFFPARKIMRRQPTRLQLITSTINHSGTAGGEEDERTDGGGEGGSTCRDPILRGNTRVNIDFLKGMRSTHDPEARVQILERQNINGTIQLQHYIQPKVDSMAPLLLPDLHSVDGGYQDRIDSYFSSARAPLNQRSRSFFDPASSSISGRSFRSLYTSHRPTGSRHQLRSMKSQRGQNVLHEADDDVSSGVREVPIDLKSSPSAAQRSGSQVV